MHEGATPPALSHPVVIEGANSDPGDSPGEPVASTEVAGVPPREKPRRTHGSKGFVSLLLLAAGTGILAFVVPWFTIHSSIGSWSYSPLQNMFAAYVGILDDIGGGWFLLIMITALIAYWTRTPAVCAVGMIAMIPTLVVLAVLCAGCFFVPSLVPQGLVPTRFHHYIPQVAGGFGALLSLVSSAVLMVWFVVLFVHSRRLKKRTRVEFAAI